MLYEEAKSVDLTAAELIQGHKVRRERKSFKLLNQQLFKLWELYSESKINTNELLERGATTYAKHNTFRFTKNPDDERELELEIV